MATNLWTFRDETIVAIGLDGFEVRARDGAVGKVVRTTSRSDGGYLVVDPGSAMPLGRNVLVPAGLVEAVGVDERRVSVNADREQIRNAPEYDATRPLDQRSRTAFGSYYGGFAGGRPVATRRPARSRPSSSKRATSARATTSGRSRPADEPTKQELYEQAKRLGIEGRSKMSKSQLARAVERQRGRASAGRPTGAKANPVEVQKFLEGVGYPTRKRQLVQEARSQGASQRVRATLERLPEKKFDSPTEVSEEIGKLG